MNKNHAVFGVSRVRIMQFAMINKQNGCDLLCSLVVIFEARGMFNRAGKLPKEKQKKQTWIETASSMFWCNVCKK